MKELVELRNARKKKKPTFLRQDGHKLDKLSKKWIKPKGLDSKMRRGLKGYRVSPSPGYSSPRLVKGLARDGLREIIVYNVHDLSKIGKNDIAVIGGSVGTRKKVEIIKKAKEMKLNIRNVKDTDAFIKKVDDKLAHNKKEKETRKERKKKAKEEALKKKEKEKKEETKEEKTEEEKKEKQEVLKKEKIEKKHEVKESKEAKQVIRPQRMDGNR